jgi:hypothetical protein
MPEPKGETESVREALNETLISLQSAVAQHLCDRVHDAAEPTDDPCLGCVESAADLLHTGWDQRILDQLGETTERIEWGHRYPSGNVLTDSSEAVARSRAVISQARSGTPPLVLVRRTVTDWEEVDA